MALRGGGQRKQKRLSVGKIRNLERKASTWTIKSHPGPHSDAQSVPLGFIIRDLLKIGSTLKEAKRILNSGIVLIDGKIRKDYKFPVGLFDVFSMKIGEKQMAFRVLVDPNGRIFLKESNEKSSTKIVRIMAKKMVKKGLIQLTTNDGRTFKEKVSKHRVGDSLQIELPKQKILKNFEFKQGNTVFIIGGKNVGRIAKIKEISESTMKRKKTITLDDKGKQFKTTYNNVFVVGEKQPVIELI